MDIIMKLDIYEKKDKDIDPLLKGCIEAVECII